MENETQPIFELGKKYLDENKLEDAENTFARVSQLDPENSDYHAWYAQALISVKKYENALEEANISVKLNPENPKGYRQIGTAYRRLDNNPKAIENFQKAIQISPNDQFAHFYLAQTYYDVKELQNASIYIARAMDLDPRNINIVNWGKKLFEEINDYESYFIATARAIDISGNGIGTYSTKEVTDPKSRLELEAVNNHFHTTLYPKLRERGEKIISYWPIHLIVWDRVGKQQFVNGASFPMEYGKAGVGLIYLTNQYLRIVSVGKLTKPLKTGGMGKFLRFFLPVADRFEACETDQFWEIVNKDIQSAQVVTDNHINQKSVCVTTSPITWYLYPFYTNALAWILAALNAAKSGKFSDIWAPKEIGSASKHSEVITLIKNLAELRDTGVISKEEFETKKKELLTRL